MPAAFVITSGDPTPGPAGHEVTIPVPERGAVLGRADDADITINAGPLSRRHARIDRRDDLWWLADLGSTNGTWCNGEPIGADPVVIGDGDEVVLGGAVALRFVDDEATTRGPRIGRLVGLWLDADTGAVWIDAVRLEPPLSGRQLDLLRLLVTNEDEVVDRATIVAEVWADVAADGVSDDAVTALIKRLRSRLDEHAGAPALEIVRGRGVRLRNPG